MCDLPKYASRWWATSCTKRIERRPRVTEPKPHTSHQSGVERASR